MFNRTLMTCRRETLTLGGLGLGPALPPKSGRQAFRGVLDVDDGTWNRARGLRAHQGGHDHPVLPGDEPGVCHHGEAHRRRGPRRRLSA